jgi:hypothetical protein
MLGTSERETIKSYLYNLELIIKDPNDPVLESLYLEGLNDERGEEKTYKFSVKLITRTLMKVHDLNTSQKYEKERKTWRRRIPLRITITSNEANFGTSPSPPSLSPYFLFIRCIFYEVNLIRFDSVNYISIPFA